MHERDEQETEQGRDQEPDPEIHDRFDHDATPYPLRLKKPLRLRKVTPQTMRALTMRFSADGTPLRRD
jgi:hypothetical protein